MTSKPDSSLTAPAPQAAAPKVVPMFVCAGAKDVPIEHAIFPHGSGFSSMSPCPTRDICVWYASYDLGGKDAYNEFPEEMLLPASFTTRPFVCPHFRDIAQRASRKRCARSESLALSTGT